MKNIFAFAFFLIAFTLSAQTDIFLSDPFPVAPDDTYGSRAPRITLLEDGRPVIYWGKVSSNPVLYIAVWQGGDFGEPIAIPTNGIELDLWGAGLGPQIAAEGTAIFLVFESYGEGIYCVRSLDGGVTFDNPVSVYDLPANRVATLPSVAIDQAGNPVVSFVTTNFQEEEALYEIAFSDDGGETFKPSVVANIAAGEEVCECCPATMSVLPNDEMLLTFRNNDNNLRDIWASKSTDGGQTFPEATDIDETNWQTFTCPSSGPHAMISGDNLVTTFFSAGQGISAVYVSAMDIPTMEKGVQFVLPTFTGDQANQNYPRIAGQLDTIGVVYQETADLGQDVILAYSVNGTTDLPTQRIKVGEGILSQRYPDVVYDDGIFHIVYEDQAEGRIMYRQAGFEPVTTTKSPVFDEFQIAIHPNPFQDKTTVTFDNSQNDPLSITLHQASGQVVQSYKTRSNSLEINRATLPAGTYWLRVVKKGKVVMKKIFVL